jgi:hypothetical protein
MMVLDVEEPDGCNDCPLCQTVHLRSTSDGIPVMASKCFISRQKGFYLKDKERMTDCPIISERKRIDYEGMDG